MDGEADGAGLQPGAEAPAAAAPPAAPAAAPAAAAPAAAPAAAAPPPPAPKSAIEAAVLGLEASGLKLDQAPPDDIIRSGEPSKTEAGAPDVARTAGESTPASVEPGKAPADSAEEALPEEDLPNPTDAELGKLERPFRRRFKQVIQQNARLKDELATVQPGAQQFQKLQSFLASHELDPRAAANALRIAALAQGAFNGRVDPSQAVSELQQWLDQLRGLAGDSLPADVQKSLDDGDITEAHAKEIARLRAAQTTTARRAELDTAAVNTRAAAAHADHIASAIRTWEAAVRARDPDYARKAKTVESHAVSLRLQRYAGGLPPSVKDGIALVQEAYEFANEQFKGVLAPRADVRQPLNGATPSKSTVRAEPKTALEAALQGLERMGT